MLDARQLGDDSLDLRPQLLRLRLDPEGSLTRLCDFQGEPFLAGEHRAQQVRPRAHEVPERQVEVELGPAEHLQGQVEDRLAEPTRPTAFSDVEERRRHVTQVVGDLDLARVGNQRSGRHRVPPGGDGPGRRVGR